MAGLDGQLTQKMGHPTPTCFTVGFGFALLVTQEASPRLGYICFPG